MNVLISALKAKKFKDIQRETGHFIKKSNHQEMIGLMKELSTFAENMETLEGASKSKEKERQEIATFVANFDKNLRMDRVDELESLKNRSKNQAHLNELSVLL